MQHLSTLDPNGATGAENRLKSQYPDQRVAAAGLPCWLDSAKLPGCRTGHFCAQLEEGAESALLPVTQGHWRV